MNTRKNFESKPAHRILFFLFYISIFIYFLKYETIVRSSTPRLLVIQIQIQVVCSKNILFSHNNIWMEFIILDHCVGIHSFPHDFKFEPNQRKQPSSKVFQIASF